MSKFNPMFRGLVVASCAALGLNAWAETYSYTSAALTTDFVDTGIVAPEGMTLETLKDAKFYGAFTASSIHNAGSVTTGYNSSIRDGVLYVEMKAVNGDNSKYLKCVYTAFKIEAVEEENHIFVKKEAAAYTNKEADITVPCYDEDGNRKSGINNGGYNLQAISIVTGDTYTLPTETLAAMNETPVSTGAVVPLEILADSDLTGLARGGYIADDTPMTGYNVTKTYDNHSNLTGVNVEFECVDGGYVKVVSATFGLGVSGLTVKAKTAFARNGNGENDIRPGVKFFDGDTLINATTVGDGQVTGRMRKAGTLSKSGSNNGYGVKTISGTYNPGKTLYWTKTAEGSEVHWTATETAAVSEEEGAEAVTIGPRDTVVFKDFDKLLILDDVNTVRNIKIESGDLWLGHNGQDCLNLPAGSTVTVSGSGNLKIGAWGNTNNHRAQFEVVTFDGNQVLLHDDITTMTAENIKGTATIALTTGRTLTSKTALAENKVVTSETDKVIRTTTVEGGTQYSVGLPTYTVAVPSYEHATAYYTLAHNNTTTNPQPVEGTSVTVDKGSPFTAFYVVEEGYEITGYASSGVAVSADKKQARFYYSAINGNQNFNPALVITAAGPTSWETITEDDLPESFAGADLATVKTWAAAYAGDYSAAALAGLDVEAFLLNCAAEDVATEKTNFTIVSIEQGADGEWIVKVADKDGEGQVGEGEVYGNGYVVIESVKEELFPEAGDDADFFKATLQVAPPSAE